MGHLLDTAAFRECLSQRRCRSPFGTQGATRADAGLPAAVLALYMRLSDGAIRACIGIGRVEMTGSAFNAPLPMMMTSPIGSGRFVERIAILSIAVPVLVPVLVPVPMLLAPRRGLTEDRAKFRIGLLRAMCSQNCSLLLA